LSFLGGKSEIFENDFNTILSIWSVIKVGLALSVTKDLNALLGYIGLEHTQKI